MSSIINKINTCLTFLDTYDDRLSVPISSDDSHSNHIIKDDDICLKCKTNFKPINVKKGDMVRKLDIHCHILPRDIPDWKQQFGYGGFIYLARDELKPGWATMVKTFNDKDDEHFREIDEKCWSLEARLKDMDNEGVHVQVLSTVPVMFNYWTKKKDGALISQFLNNDLAESISKYPNRFIGLATLPLQDIKESVKELKRIFIKNPDTLGKYYVGIIIGSHIEKWNLDDKRFKPVWKILNELKLCCFVHPWDMMGFDSLKKYWLPWLVSMPAETSRAICSLMFGGIFKDYPNINFCFAHGGGSFPHTIGRIQHGYNCRPDLIQINLKGDNESPMKWLGKFCVDSLVHDYNAFEYLVKIIGYNNIVLGTDYPFPLGECYPLKQCGQLIQQHPTLSKKIKEKLLWYNGLKLINKNNQYFYTQKPPKNKLILN